MKRLLFTLAAFVLVANTLTTSQASPRLVNTGLCFNGASWEFTAKRSKDVVTFNLTFKTVPAKTKWNINYSYTPVNLVDNRAAVANNQGIVFVTTRVTSPKPVNALFIIESWAPMNTFYCAGVITA